MAIPHRFSCDYARKKPATRSVVEMVTKLEQKAPESADTVAARAIARYNVERRRAGKTPLDLNGIGRLRQLLTEEIERPGSVEEADAH